MAEHGHLRFNAHHRQNSDMQKLREQFRGFPDDFVDGLDCIEGAISKLDKKARSKNFKPRAGKYRRDTSKVG
jgi:hypothetical protein